MNPLTRYRVLLVAFGISYTGLVFSQVRPQVTQTLDSFNRPIAAAFSPDGRNLYVINHVQGESGTLRNQSFLSKLKVSPDGEVKPERMRFVDSLTAPIDLDFSPIRFGSIPQGSIFVVFGSPLVQDEAGRMLKDISRIRVGFLVIDAQSGRILKQIDVSPNSKRRLKGEDGLLAPSCLAFDKRGNLYIGESGIGGHMFQNRQVGRPGIWRLEAKAVMDLVTDVKPADIEFIRTSSLPGDLCYRKSDDMIYFVTNHHQGRPAGSVFRIPAADYTGISSMQTIVRELGALSGLQITPKGRVLMIGNNGELQFPKGKKDSRPIRFRPKVEFSAPGKLGLISHNKGKLIIAVPEQSSDAGLAKGQRVRIVTLPDDY